MKLQRPDPGIDAAKSGLHGKAGIFFNAGLFSKGGGFNPLDLDPYLLFDAQTSMIGTLENPTLDLDPSKQDTLDVITATRAGTATYTDFNGNIATAPSDTVRVDYVDSVPMILVEPSATNLVESSDINSDWGFYSNDSTITQHTSDLGEINAYVLSRIGSNQKTSLQHGDISGGSTTNATASLFYKNIGEARFFQFWDTNLSGNNFVNVDTISDAFNASAGSAKITNLGNGWRRLEWTRPDSASQSSGKIRLSLADSLGDSRNSNFAGTGGIAFAGVQLEEGDVATSFIPTSGSTVTRAADNLVISGSDFSGFFNASEGTTYVETILKSKTGTPHFFEYYDESSANSNRMGSYIPALGVNYYVLPGSCNISMGTFNDNQLNRFAVSYKTDDMLGSVNGASEQPDTSATLPSGVDTLSIGNMNTGAFPMTGHIKRLIYWPTHSNNL